MIVKALNRLLGLILVLVVVALLSIWAFSPWIVRHYAPQILSPLGFTLSEDSSIRLNPFRGAISLDEVSLRLEGEDKPQASISEGLIDISLFSLTQKTLSFDALEFDTTEINIVRQDDALRIAGYELPNEETSEPSKDDTTPSLSSQEQAAALSAWSLELPELAIDNLRLEISDQGKQHDFELSALRLKGLLANTRSQSGHIELSAKINSAELSVEAELSLENGLGEVDFQTQLRQFQGTNVAYLLERQLSQLSGALSFDLQGHVSLLENGITLDIRPSTIETANISFNSPELSVRESSLKLDTQGIQLNAPKNGAISVQGDIAVTANDLEFGPPNSQDVLVAISSLSVPLETFSWQGANDEAPMRYKVQVPKIDLTGLKYSQVKLEQASADSKVNAADQQALLELSALSIAQLNASDKALSVERIELGKLDAHVLVDEQQQVTNLVSLQPTPSPKATTKPANEEAPTTEKAPATDEAKDDAEKENAAQSDFMLSLASFSIKEPGTLDFIYQGVEPAYKQSLSLDRFELSKLDSHSPLNYSHLDLAFSAGQYTKATIKGDIAPFAGASNLTLDIDLKEFVLPQISPFIRTAAGFDMASGQLDSQTKVAIVNDEISGESVIEIRGLEIENASDVHTGSLAEKTFIPLNVALGTLKDSDGRIELEIPLKGNVNSPDFGVDGFLNLVAQRAAIAASQSYVINTFVPYANIVTLTSIAGSYALKPRLDDLYFDNGQTDLNDAQKTFLDKVAHLLEDKSDKDMRVCGFSTLSEQEIADASSKPTQLPQLAQARSAAVKHYLVTVKSIASSRVQVCKAKVDQREDAQARVEFEF